MNKVFCFIILAAFISTVDVAAAGVKSLIILNFENKGFRMAGKDFSTWIPALIQAELVKSPVISIVERGKLNEVLKEQALSQTGLIDENTAIKVGKLMGAQKILLGEYQANTKEKYSISSRLVDIEKGNIEGQWLVSDISKKEIEKYAQDVAAAVNQKIKNLVALENLAGLENKQQPFQVFIAAEKDSFPVGDMLTLTLTAGKNCYLQIFDAGTSGKIHLLFPNKMQPNNYLPAGDTLRVENIRVSPPTGTELVKVIATTDSVTINKMLDIAGSPQAFQLLGDDTEKFSRDLELMVSPLPNNKWTTATLQLEIIN